MDNDKYPDDTEQDDISEEEYTEDPDAVELYSKTAIFWFTLFFTTLFGGIMLNMNLRNAGYKKAAVSVLLFSVGFYLLSAISAAPALVWLQTIISVQPIYLAAIFSFVTNVAGGLILTRYFYKKYLPDEDYYPRSIITPLGIAIGIFVLQSILLNLTGIKNIPGF